MSNALHWTEYKIVNVCPSAHPAGICGQDCDIIYGPIFGPKFWAVGNVLLGWKFSSENVKFGAENSHLGGGNWGATLKFWAPVIFCVGNFQLSVRKLQLLAPAYFINPRHQWPQQTWQSELENSLLEGLSMGLTAVSRGTLSVIGWCTSACCLVCL